MSRPRAGAAPAFSRERTDSLKHLETPTTTTLTSERRKETGETAGSSPLYLDNSEGDISDSVMNEAMNLEASMLPVLGVKWGTCMSFQPGNLHESSKQTDLKSNI
jgi:hypothetical protein